MKNYTLFVLLSAGLFSCKKDGGSSSGNLQLLREVNRTIGDVWTYEYDGAGHLIRGVRSDTSGRISSMTEIQDSLVNYNDFGGGVFLTDHYSGALQGKPSSAVRYYTGAPQPYSMCQLSYDAAGRLVTVVDNHGDATNISYDGSGNVAKMNFVYKGTKIWELVTRSHDDHPNVYTSTGLALSFINLSVFNADPHLAMVLSRNNLTDIQYTSDQNGDLRVINTYTYDDRGYPASETSNWFKSDNTILIYSVKTFAYGRP